MIPLLSRADARALDADAVRVYGLPTCVLMENAGRGATGVLLDRLRGAAAEAVIVGGLGQNGGDAWVVARHLVVAGMRPRVFLCGSPPQVKGDAWVNLNALLALGVDVTALELEGVGVLEESLRSAKVVVDGLFGTGLTRPVEGLAREVIRVMNAFPAPKFALDLPSGIDANSGAVMGENIRAAITATFGCHKRGLYQQPGAAAAGEVALVSIGMPFPTRSSTRLFEAEDAAERVTPRRPDAHKGSAGHVVIVAGSDEAPGAAVLAGVAALRAGAGKVTVWTRARALNAPPDLLVRPFREETPAAVEECVAFVRDHADSVVIGPGLGLDAFAATLCHQVARQMKMPVVLDADALTHAAADPSIFKASPGPRVVTPHPKEAARLLSCDVRDIQADRYRAVLRIAREFQVVSCLKGSHTVLAEPEGEIRVVRRGSPALAVAGTGDVLAGAVGAHVVALPAMDGASVAVLQHAVAGELASVGDRGLLASEVAAALPAALASFCSDDVVLDDV